MEMVLDIQELLINVDIFGKMTNLVISKVVSHVKVNEKQIPITYIKESEYISKIFLNTYVLTANFS